MTLAGQELAKHGVRVLTTLGTVIQGLTDLDSLMPELRTLCQRHIKYGATRTLLPGSWRLCGVLSVLQLRFRILRGPTREVL